MRLCAFDRDAANQELLAISGALKKTKALLACTFGMTL
jgi:hypothetical protein